MSAAHTPGPWEVVEGEKTLLKIVATTPRGLKKSIAQVGGYGGESRICNARAMACAPEMLAELRLALVVYETFGSVEAATKVRALLAKATGQEGGAK